VATKQTEDLTAQSHRWHGRPVLSAAVRSLVLLLPLAASVIVVQLVVKVGPQAHRGSAIWFVGLLVMSLATAVVVERLARAFLPLATLLKLTMLFPDKAPSRFKVARGASSTRRLQEKVEIGKNDTESAVAEKILALVAALAAHDRKTRGHAERVRVFTDLLAEQLKMSQPDRDRLRWSALLHDIGKLHVSARILNKPAKLTEHEWTEIRQHPARGAELAGPLLPWLGKWGDAILEHHERYDGLGYPRGLAREEISLGGRILGVVDAFEVMTAARSYKDPMATRAARTELARCAGSQFDPEIVRSFLAISLPRLLWAMGPLSIVFQLPALRVVQQATGRLGTSVATGAMTVTAAGVAVAATAVAPVPRDAIPPREPTHSVRRVSLPDRPSASPPRASTSPHPSAAPSPTPPGSAPASPPASSPASPPAAIPPAVLAPSASPSQAPTTAASPAPTQGPVVDSTAPTTTFTSAPSGTVPSSTVSASFTGNDPAAAYQCQLDGGGWASCTSPVTYSGLADGPHTIAVRGIDPAGNVGTADTANFTVDNTAPTATFTSAPSGTVASSTVSASFTGNDPAAVYQCHLDGGGWASCTSPVTYSGLADGPHTIAVRAVDQSGNAGSAATAGFTVRTAAPTITSKPNARTKNRNARFAFADPGLAFQCSLDGAAFTACTSPQTYTGLRRGFHVFRVRGVDSYGNVTSTTSYTWTIR